MKKWNRWGEYKFSLLFSSLLSSGRDTFISCMLNTFRTLACWLPNRRYQFYYTPANSHITNCLNVHYKLLPSSKFYGSWLSYRIAKRQHVVTTACLSVCLPACLLSPACLSLRHIFVFPANVVAKFSRVRKVALSDYGHRSICPSVRVGPPTLNNFQLDFHVI
jgi:hypothetical protein